MRAALLLALLAPTSAFFADRREPKMAMVTPIRKPSSKVMAAPLAMVIPGDSLAEVIIVDGGLNFLSIYQGLITLRILLSWCDLTSHESIRADARATLNPLARRFPQAQSVAVLAPLFTVSDVYLNLFRGVVPPIGGIDIRSAAHPHGSPMLGSRSPNCHLDPPCAAAQSEPSLCSIC